MELILFSVFQKRIIKSICLCNLISKTLFLGLYEHIYFAHHIVNRNHNWLLKRQLAKMSVFSNKHEQWLKITKLGRIWSFIIIWKLILLGPKSFMGGSVNNSFSSSLNSIGRFEVFVTIWINRAKCLSSFHSFRLKYYLGTNFQNYFDCIIR